MCGGLARAACLIRMERMRSAVRSDQNPMIDLMGSCYIRSVYDRMCRLVSSLSSTCQAANCTAAVLPCRRCHSSLAAGDWAMPDTT